jgi:hypothetical protein
MTPTVRLSLNYCNEAARDHVGDGRHHPVLIRSSRAVLAADGGVSQ